MTRLSITYAVHLNSRGITMKNIALPRWVVAIVIAAALLLVGALLWNSATSHSSDIAVPLDLGGEGQLAPSRTEGAASEP